MAEILQCGSFEAFLREHIPWEWSPARPDPEWWRDPRLADSLRTCRETTRKHARSFFFASIGLPRFRKEAAFAIYAFCRHVDDSIDEGGDAAPSAGILRGQLDDLLAGDNSVAFAPAFRRVVSEFAIPRIYLDDLIAGCCLDRRPVKIATFDELQVYCYHVASVVGLILCHVFGLSDGNRRREAVDMGIAMQLTNILRDVREDFALARIYLPRAELEAAGIDPDLLADHPVDERWQAFMQAQVERARSYYERAFPALRYLAADGSRLTGAMMATIYAGILDEIEKRDGDVFSERVSVSFAGKCQRAVDAWKRTRKWPRQATESPRGDPA